MTRRTRATLFLVLGVVVLGLEAVLLHEHAMTTAGMLGTTMFLVAAIQLILRPDLARGWRAALAVGSVLLLVGVAVDIATHAGQALQPGGNLEARWAGEPAPDFTVATLDGRTLKLSDLRGKRVVLDFWATWCPPCRRELPHFVALANETRDDGVVIVGITDEERETVEPFVHASGLNYPIAIADDLPRPYSDVHAIPTTFFIDEGGVIRHVLRGYHDLDALRAATR